MQERAKQVGEAVAVGGGSDDRLNQSVAGEDLHPGGGRTGEEDRERWDGQRDHEQHAPEHDADEVLAGGPGNQPEAGDEERPEQQGDDEHHRARPEDSDEYHEQQRLDEGESGAHDRLGGQEVGEAGGRCQDRRHRAGLDLGCHQRGQGEGLDEQYEEHEHRPHLLLQGHLVAGPVLAEDDLGSRRLGDRQCRAGNGVRQLAHEARHGSPVLIGHVGGQQHPHRGGRSRSERSSRSRTGSRGRWEPMVVALAFDRRLQGRGVREGDQLEPLIGDELRSALRPVDAHLERLVHACPAGTSTSRRT